ncbi:MAG: hypothetical protein JJU36_06420 [Phycisphaeraceae bacterium]|nr:hypothetical protein [Phycisphaeraceae bacterium]
MLIAALICCMSWAGGCGSGRTVLVLEDAPMRTGPNMSGRVYVMTEGAWRLSSQSISIPEGWYLLPPSFVPDE